MTSFPDAHPVPTSAARPSPSGEAGAEPSPDAASGEAPEPFLRRLASTFHVYGVFWYKLHLFAVRHLPRWTYYVLVPLFTAFFFCTLRKIRGAIARNLEAVLGPCGFVERQRRIWRNLYVYSWCLTERYEGLATERRVEPVHENHQYWEQVLSTGEGFVLVTAHIGHWEAGSAFPAELQDRRIHVVREEEIDERSQRFFEELVSHRFGSEVTMHFAHRDPHLGARLLLAIRRGEIVALQGDRPARGGRTEEVELFGKAFEVPAGPAAVARSAGVPILPVFVYRDGRYRARTVFHPPIRLPKTGDRDADIRRGVEQIVGAIDRAIRRDPYQWFCFRDFWKPRG